MRNRCRAGLLPAALALALVLSGCTTAIPGTPVVTGRVRAEATAYRACARAVDTVERDVDAVLDAMPSGSPPGSAQPDRAALGRLYERMAGELQSGCGYWSVQGMPLSAVVLYLAQQGTARRGVARAATASMIASICGSVESPLDTYGVTLTADAHAVCAAG